MSFYSELIKIPGFVLEFYLALHKGYFESTDITFRSKGFKVHFAIKSKVKYCLEKNFNVR